MYEKYFGFNTLPFRITPDPRFCYDHPDCREAMATLCYGIDGRKGFILITGEPGTGKTRLVKDFMQRAEVKIRSVSITTPKLNVTELLREVLNELGIAPSTQDRATLTLQLKDYLVEQFKKHRVVALLVDEAQQLSNELLEDLRLLSNLETNEDKLIQIVLVGQPELEERLDQPELRQLRQRIALRCRLVPLKDQEVYFYIQARLKTAGLKETSLFDPGAVAKITLYSNGIPRLINVICDSALLTCYALSKKKISADIIEEVARDLQISVRRPIGKSYANHDAARDAGRVVKEVAPLTSVSQRPLAEEIQDVFIAGEQRRLGIHRRPSLASLATGITLGIFAATGVGAIAGVGAIFYSQSNGNYLSEIAARIGDEIHRRETLNAGAAESGTLHDAPLKELKDVQPMASEMPLTSTQQPEESSGEANAAPILEASKTGSYPGAAAQDRLQEQQTEKKDEKKEEAIKRPTKDTGKKSVNDRLELDIHRAIAKRAIRGVAVTVIDGTVVLRGRVDTENQKIAATKAASDVPGVKYIRDQIIVNDDVAS
jgi:general secretion pathway protein A